MQEAWIDLECPNCGELWEAKLVGLPSPDDEHTCEHCGDKRSMTEFPHTGRDLEVLTSFHQG